MMVLRAYPRSTVWVGAGLYVAMFLQTAGIAR